MDKNKKIIVGVALGIAGVIIVSALGFKMLFETKLNVHEEVKVEVGDTVVLEPKTFADSSMTDTELEKVNLSSKLLKDDTAYKYNQDSHEVVSRGKKYLEVGTYEITLKSGNKEAKSKLIVEDTKGPVITEKGTDHRCPVGTESFDYTSLVDITDYSDFDVEINDTAVNLNQNGSYTVTFSAKDEYGNLTTLDVTLNVGDANYTVIQPTEEEPTDYTDMNVDTNTDEDYDDEPEMDWREKYKHQQEYGDDSDFEDDEDDDSNKKDFGSIKNKVFQSTDEAQQWIDNNIMGKGYVSWTIENMPNGKVKYNFNYED